MCGAIPIKAAPNGRILMEIMMDNNDNNDDGNEDDDDDVD